jgi:3-dehydroquinate synthase
MEVVQEKSVITVEVPQDPYQVVIAVGGLDHLGAWLTDYGTPRKLGKKILLVSNPTVFALYGERAIATLKAAGYQVASHLIPDGEQYKTLDSIVEVYNAAQAHHLERSSAIVALGGGVIGDMAGFAAATWLRGIQFVQVPTSLLAMVDASIGGKTGVNHPLGKNLIGAFHQPRLVLIDPQVLHTLPVREFRAGMAEVIKYGVIWDADLFAQMEAETDLSHYSSLSPSLLQAILQRSCQAKAIVVGQDEKEAGLRAILNYGHTIGHAVESITGYTQLIHGEAVAIGMVAAGEIAVRLGLWSQSLSDRQTALIRKAELPTQIPAGLDLDHLMALLQSDKKVEDGKVRFIVPTAIGAVKITDQVPAAVVRAVLKQIEAN